MRLLVEYTGQLRTAFGRSSEWIELDEQATATDLLMRLATSGEANVRPHFLNSAGQFQPSLLIAVNGTAYLWQQLDSIVLHDEDNVILLPPIGGG